jgi:hypothetical protein
VSERGHLEELGLEGKSIEMYFQEVGWKVMNWIETA